MEYTLTRKKNNKRVVLRVKDGAILVSAPFNVPESDIKRFVNSKQKWIEKQLANPPKALEHKDFDDDECLKLFNAIADNVYTLISHKVKKLPKIFVKDYKSRWGVCYPARGYIILNKQLFDKPISAIEQVILHEYVHFLYQNHGKGFHKMMAKLMPDYKERRKLLLK